MILFLSVSHQLDTGGHRYTMHGVSEFVVFYSNSSTGRCGANWRQEEERERKLVDRDWSYCDVGLIKENV